MANKATSDADPNLRAMHEAIVDYHSQLANIRFTVVALYLAATGFLASTWFSGIGNQYSLAYALIPLLGKVLTVLCWLMELRTAQLLRNLDERGRHIESLLRVDPDLGFFYLMFNQPTEATVPFIRPPLELPRFRWIQYFISHSFGLHGLYATILAFWFLVGWLT